MMTESILDRVELTAVAKPGIIEVTATVDSTGCTDLRRIHVLFANHGHPSWPQKIDIIYGWRSLTRTITLKSINSNGSANYLINNEMLYEMNLLDPPFYVKDVVYLRIEFSEDVIINSIPFRIGSANSIRNSGISHDSLLRLEEKEEVNSQVSFAAGSSNNKERGESQPSSNWGQTMARAWAGSEGGSQVGESEFEDEGWDTNMDGRRCWIGCCSPCYSTCQCLWHLGRSTPTTALISMGLAIAVICIYNFYVPVVRQELEDANLELGDRLFNLLRTSSIVILICDTVFVITCALLMGTTKEIICASLYSGELQYSPDKKWKCHMFARCLRNCGGMMVIKFLVLLSFGSICLAGFLTFTITIAWYSASLASLSCTLDDDDSLNASETDNLFQLFDKALVWTDFSDFNFNDYCIEHSTYVSTVHLKREESIYQHLLILLIACAALVAAQVIFFTLMVDNHRVALIAAAEYEDEINGDYVAADRYDNITSQQPGGRTERFVSEASE